MEYHARELVGCVKLAPKIPIFLRLMVASADTPTDALGGVSALAATPVRKARLFTRA